MIGTTIGEKHTYRDWGLRWISCNTPMPDVQVNEITVPGRDGVIDLTESLTGEPLYHNRTVELVFDARGIIDDWQQLYSEIAAYCHGKQFKIILDTDPDYYYYGRIAVNTTKNSRQNGTLTITAGAEPYKYELKHSAEDWEWDSFHFITGIIRGYKNIPVCGSKALTVIGTGKTIVPSIECSAPMTITSNGVPYYLKAGNNKNPEVKIFPGENRLSFTGNGVVSIQLRGVCL